MPVALLLPGLSYSHERPLLSAARTVFTRHGWSTRDIRWPGRPPEREGQELHVWFARLQSFVHAHVGRVLDEETEPRIALVGKSMGAFAAARAAERGLPAIWLTPVLRDSPLPADLRRATAPFLLVGGTADPAWDPEVARGFGQPVYEAENADHSMETPGRDLLPEIIAAMEAFVLICK